MGDNQLEDRLKVFIGTDEDNSIQIQFSELVQTVCTSIQAVNSEYESAVYILNFENNQFLAQILWENGKRRGDHQLKQKF